MQAAEEQLTAESLVVVERAKAIRITDQSSYTDACRYLQQVIIPFRRRWAEYWDPLRKNAWAAYKAIQDKFNEGDTPAEQAERAIKNQIRKWDDEQEKIEQERQRQAQLEAEKAAEEERLRAAIYAETSGASESEVQAIVEAPVAVVAAPVEPTYQRAAGVSKRENWKAKITNLHTLVKAAAKDSRLLAYIEPNQTALNQRAKAEKSTMNIPGVLAYNDPVVSARGR